VQSREWETLCRELNPKELKKELKREEERKTFLEEVVTRAMPTLDTPPPQGRPSLSLVSRNQVMSGFTREITINAPVEQVWEALGDIGSISRWNPGVVRSHVTTEKTKGVGAGRYCNLGGKNYLDEEVVEWEPGNARRV